MKNIAQKIEKAGGRLYLVGGAVRDEIIGRERKDEDYCVTGLTAEKFETMFPTMIKRGKSFGVYDLDGKEIALARIEKKIGLGHKEFEIQTNEDITIEQDLARRDITINSMARDILTGELIDPFGGKKDIEEKIIRNTTEAFSEDPLRVYRVARFASVLNFKVDYKTIGQMKLLKNELKTLSVERVFIELKKALASNKPSIFFNVLREADVLEVHFKEIFDLIGKIQPEKYHPEGDSYNHTMQVVDNSVKLTDKLEIRYSCLVHDLGKGTTPRDILPHHYGHEERGEKLVLEMGRRLKIPKLWTSCGKISAKEHMRGGIFNEMTAKKKVEFIERVGKSQLGLDGMKIVVMCDRARNGKFLDKIDFDKIGKKCLKEVTGKMIMEKYNISGGIGLKKILHEERIKWIKLQNEKTIL